MSKDDSGQTSLVGKRLLSRPISKPIGVCSRGLDLDLFFQSTAMRGRMSIAELSRVWCLNIKSGYKNP